MRCNKVKETKKKNGKKVRENYTLEIEMENDIFTRLSCMKMVGKYSWNSLCMHSVSQRFLANYRSIKLYSATRRNQRENTPFIIHITILIFQAKKKKERIIIRSLFRLDVIESEMNWMVKRYTKGKRLTHNKRLWTNIDFYRTVNIINSNELW